MENDKMVLYFFYVPVIIIGLIGFGYLILYEIYKGYKEYVYKKRRKNIRIVKRKPDV